MEILYTLEKLRVPFMNYVMLAISIIGDLGSAVPAVLIFYWCISKRSGYFVMGNTMCGSGINAALKTWFHVARPFVAHPDFEIVDIARSTAGGYSFPSGHSQNVVAVFGSLAVLIKNMKVRIACITMIILVAFSRMYLGAHYPTDVLGGLSIGVIVLIVMNVIMKKSEANPNILPIAYGIAGVALLVTAIILDNSPSVELLDPDNMENAMLGLSFGAGNMLAIAAWEPVERRYIRFETKAIWWAQILKVVLGTLAVLAVWLCARALCRLLPGSSVIEDIVSFFFMGTAIIALWPLSFRWFSRLGQSQPKG